MIDAATRTSEVSNYWSQSTQCQVCLIFQVVRQDKNVSLLFSVVSVHSDDQNDRFSNTRRIGRRSSMAALDCLETAYIWAGNLAPVGSVVLMLCAYTSGIETTEMMPYCNVVRSGSDKLGCSQNINTYEPEQSCGKISLVWPLVMAALVVVVVVVFQAYLADCRIGVLLCYVLSVGCLEVNNVLFMWCDVRLKNALCFLWMILRV